MPLRVFLSLWAGKQPQRARKNNKTWWIKEFHEKIFWWIKEETSLFRCVLLSLRLWDLRTGRFEMFPFRGAFYVYPQRDPSRSMGHFGDLSHNNLTAVNLFSVAWGRFNLWRARGFCTILSPPSGSMLRNGNDIPNDGISFSGHRSARSYFWTFINPRLIFIRFPPRLNLLRAHDKQSEMIHSSYIWLPLKLNFLSPTSHSVVRWEQAAREKWGQNDQLRTAFFYSISNYLFHLSFAYKFFFGLNSV